MILLALRITPNLTGHSHIQVNPFHAYSTTATVSSALRIRSLIHKITPTYSIHRLCIKIPATWEGLAACRVLEHDHELHTLATTLFTLEQAVLAGKAGCRYVAPYVNELKVHFEAGYVDPAPALELCAKIQGVYEREGGSTMVLPASLTSVAECMALAGAKHITIAPALLRGLAEMEMDEEGVMKEFPSVFDVVDAHGKVNGATKGEGKAFAKLQDEATFRMAMTRSSNGRDEGKLTQAINIFCDCQVKLEALMVKVLEVLV